jgi:hypothetical protein
VQRAIRALHAEFFPKELVASAAQAVVSVDPSTPKRWRDMGDYLILTVVVDRVSTGEEWIAHTDEKGNRTNDCSRRVLSSDKFQTTPEGVYEIAVLKGTSFSCDPYAKEIREKAKQMQWVDPNLDIAGFIRKQYSDEELKEMGFLWIAIMHKPIVSGGFSSLRSINCGGEDCWLDACGVRPQFGWDRRGGFAFLASRVS